MMTPEQNKRLGLILRQVADARLQARGILAGNRNRASVESFARFCSELNAYIRMYDKRPEVTEVMDDIPEIQYTLWPNSLFQYMYIPFWVLASQRSIVVNQIRRVCEKYEILEPRLRGMNSDMFKS